MEPGTVTKVLKDVFTTMDGELSLIKGEIFQVIKPVDKYWCHGNSCGKVGLFPTDHLIPIETPDREGNEELFLAIADFPGEQEGDLSFRKGEFVIGEKKLDEHWWKGRISLYRKGVFPDNFAWHLNSASKQVCKNSNVMNVKARVKMSLKAQLDEEMDLHIGDIVTIIEETDKGWYRGSCGDKSGIFPSAYVTLLEEPSANSETLLQDSNVSEHGVNNRNDTSGYQNNNTMIAHHYSNSSSNNQYSNFDVASQSKDMMTFSPEKEVRPVEMKPPGTDSELDILNDDYFKVNMPSMCSGNFDTDYPSLGLEHSESNSSYLAELVSELDDCSIQPYGMTLYPFYAQYANELSFHENEIVHLIRYVDEGWLEGEIDGRKGIFPVSYVNILVDCNRGWKGHQEVIEEVSNLNDLSARSYAKVLYNFDAQMNGDLSVKEGDVLMVMKVVDKDWCEVRNQSGNTGLCPSNHLAPHSVSPSEHLFRSASFSSNLEHNVDIDPTKPQPRTFEPHDFSVEYRRKDRKVDEFITKNLSGLDIIPLKRRSPIEKNFIDYKEELSVVNEGNKKDLSDISHAEEQLNVHEGVSVLKPPNYPPPPPPVPSRTSSSSLDDLNEVFIPVKVSKPAPAVPKPPGMAPNQSLHTQAGDKQAAERPQRPPPPSRRASIDRAPHRPAPPVPIAGQTPVRKSLKRLPRQTSAPCVLSEEPADCNEMKELIQKKEKQLQEMQMVHEEIENELELSADNKPQAEELRQCGAIYERKIRRLKLDIQHFRIKLDEDDESSTPIKDSVKTTKCAEEKRKKMKEQRQNVISELVMTEKEYVRDLKLTYEVFNLHNPSMLHERGIDVKALFANILEVMHAAEEFLDSLLFAMKGLSDEDQCVGPVFLKHADTIKRVYSEYCANHENALCLLEKYKTLPAAQAIFDKAMETLRYQITCFNVGSVLIKPVQRLLKYPLILNELIKCTEDQHKDKPNLLKAVQVYTCMASDINEYKRRQEIVSKYLGNGTSTLARKMAKLNLHSVAKKSSRLSAKLSSSLGLSMAPKDELFLEQERSFHILERTLRGFLRNLDLLMTHLNEEVAALFRLGENLASFYMERKNDQDVNEFRNSQRLIMSHYWEEFKNVIDRRVTNPLMTLLELFEGPGKLIEKRNDKLLDYDNCLAKAEKNKENRQFQDELIKSKNNYEALNQQLLEDLPILTTSSTDLLVECLSALLAAQKLLSGKITKQYLNLMEIPSLASVAGDAVEAFAVKHYLVCNQLGRFSFSSKAFRESGGNRKSLKTSPTPARQLGMEGQRLDQSTSQQAYLQSKYPAHKLFYISEDHVAGGPLDLALSKGHLVGVIVKKDPMGNSSRWFVDNGDARGFVVSKYLEPMNSRPMTSRFSSSPSTSANSSRSSCTTPSPNKLRPESSLSGRSIDREQSPHQSTRTNHNRQANQIQHDNMPPSYEEVTGKKVEMLYDEVPVELQHRYEEVPDVASDSSSLEQSQTSFEEEQLDDTITSSCDSEFYYALYEFNGKVSNSLPLKEGQVVIILKKQDLQGNQEWWYVEDRYGNKGYVPANYLHAYSVSQ